MSGAGEATASNPLVAAALQMCSSADLQQNLDTAARLVAEATERGANVVVLPEYFAFMGLKERDKYPIVEAPGEGVIQQFLGSLAATHRCWLVGGSIPVRSSDPKRPFGRCYVYAPDGEPRSSFDKMHLFDVDVADNMRSYRESTSCMPGDETVVCSSPWGGIGLSVCYDLRFPELYRAMAELGAMLFALPAAFTAKTGQAHWELLLRARAIENQCFVVASAQGGEHQNGRQTWGHSMIIDPWGQVLDSLADGEGIALASLDLAEQQRVRLEFPALTHRRL